MTAEKKGIYHWKLGDVALARVCQKVYARVKVVKDEKGLFYDDKVLGISANADGSISVTRELCYFVETCRTTHRFWIPYTSMHLAERSRPFYGTESKVTPSKKEIKDVTKIAPRKRKIKEDHTVPLNVKLIKEPDLNTSYDIRQMPLKQGKYENAFKEFVRRGKEMIFDQYFEILLQDVDSNKDSLDYLIGVDASTEDKFELVMKNVATKKEVENYLHQCWRYNLVRKQVDSKENTEGSKASPLKEVITVHTPWCLVCGEHGDKLLRCRVCPASFHLPCRKEWLLTVIHRKNPPKKSPRPTTLIEKVLSSTRTVCTVRKDTDKGDTDICPSCMWGPKVGYDDVVWHKLGSCPWWPARVLPPGSTPSCLLARAHSAHHWPLQYYDFILATAVKWPR